MTDEFCPVCIKGDVVYHGADRVRSETSGKLYYVKWGDCNRCGFSKQTIERIEE